MDYDTNLWKKKNNEKIRKIDKEIKNENAEWVKMICYDHKIKSFLAVAILRPVKDAPRPFTLGNSALRNQIYDKFMVDVYMYSHSPTHNPLTLIRKKSIQNMDTFRRNFCGEGI